MKGWKKSLLSCLLVFCMVLSLSGCAKNASGDDSAAGESFDEFIDRIYRDEVSCDTLTLHYCLTNPEAYGIVMDEITMGSFSQQEITDSLPELDALIEQFKSYDYDSLSEENKLIYDTLDFVLSKTRALNEYEYYSEPLGPTTGLQAQLPVLLAEYTIYTKEDIDTYLELLNCTLEYFQDVAQYEREKSEAGCFMIDDVADEIIAQCENFIANPEENLLIEHFDNIVDNFDGLSTDEIVLYKERNREAVLNSVIPAYELLISTLTELKGTAVNQKGVCGFEDGKTYFELLVQSTTGSSMTIKEIQKELESTVNTAMIRMSAAQLADPTIFDRYLNVTYPEGTPVENLEYLKEAITEDFPALETVDYTVQYLHESLQEYLSPAMYLIPPFDDRNNNRIFINPNPDYAESSLFTTLAHEGYPGHLYQNVYFLSTDPHPLRHILRSTGYTEGWGTYAELYAYELAGLDTTLATFLQDNQAAILCLYGLSEIGIHYTGWDKDDTIAFWGTYGIAADIAAEIYLDLVAEPASYLPYCLGYVEFMNLREEAEDTLDDDFSILAFHTFLLDIGPAPFEVIADRMETWMETQKTTK